MTQSSSKNRGAKAKRRKPEKLEFVQPFLPVKDIRNGIVETTDGRYIKILEIEPINFMLRSSEEQYNILSSFASWLKISPMKLQFKSITRKADSDKHVALIRKELSVEDNEQCKAMGDDYIRLIKDVGSREALTRRFFLIYQYEATLFFFCSSYQTGFRVLEEWKSNSDLRTLFTSVYKHVHFIPINEFGVQLLQILTIPHWNERLLRLFFKNEYRSFGMGDMPYDAQMSGTYVLSFLDSDFARLYLFRNNIGNFPDRKWLVLCFQHQAKFLREYLGPGVRLKVIPMAEVMEKLNIKRRELI